MTKAKKAENKVVTTVADIRAEDCITGMAKLAAASVDVAVTSPPYNLGIDYTKYMDRKEQDEYLEWCVEWTRSIRRVIKDYGSFFLNLGSSPSNPTIPHLLIAQIVKDKKFKLQNEIHWIKSITITDDDGGELSKGHFKPINSERFVNDCHEYIFHLTPTGDTPLDRLAVGVEYKHKSNVTRWEKAEGMDKRCRGNTWFIPYKTIHNRSKQRPHPATFPIELPEQCIRLHGNREAVVMDPFMGVGSTWIGSIRCNAARFIGFEIDPSYIELAKGYAADPKLLWPDSN